MRLLEHQAKQLLTGFGLCFTQPRLADSPAAAATLAAEVGGPVVLKAQVPFGGRGKGGFVKFASEPAQAERAAAELLGQKLHGQTIYTVSVEEQVAFTREVYAGVAWDSVAKVPVALLGSEGGVEIEGSGRGAVQRQLFDPWSGLPAYLARELAARAGFKGKAIAELGGVLEQLAQAFLACDAVLAEINPLVELAGGDWLGLDARVEIEDDAFYRQKHRLEPLGELVVTATGRAPTPMEQLAQSIDASDHRGVAGRMIEFDGDLALLIGGGGASLTVFDAVRRHGGSPANYCEIGGNPTEDKVAALTTLLAGPPHQRKLAVIMNVVNNTRADVIARGVLMGLERAGRSPGEALLVFRVPGSWEQEARVLLDRVGITALGREVSLDAAAQLAVERMKPYAA